MRRRFDALITVETDATDDELMAAARATYEGHTDDPSIPTVGHAVTDLILDGLAGGLLRPSDDPPAAERT